MLLKVDTMQQNEYISDYISKLLDLIHEKINRYLACSMLSCVHCGTCTSSCHYSLSRPGDPTMAPVFKADQVRRIFRRHIDWTGRIVPWWVGAGSPPGDEDLAQLKDIVFGTCTACRRCTIYCPMGVDNAALIRFTRGLLTEIGFVPEGILNVCRNQRETGNQMGISQEEYLDTLLWIKEELQFELDDPDVDIPIDQHDCDFMYVINPREVKFDPRPLINAVKIFHRSGERWTLPKEGWDQTNFGVFSGDDRLGGFMARNVYTAAEKLRAKRIVVSECGHGYRAVRWEGYNWANYEQRIPTESVVVSIMHYIKTGRIVVDRSRNTDTVTFHDSCSIARFGDLIEEPRWVLKQICSDFQEMHPHGVENYCCTGGGGMLAMSEYRQLRLESAQIKADQLKATGAKLVCTMCHNCRDGLNDLVEHYGLGMRVVQIMDLVANALVFPP